MALTVSEKLKLAQVCASFARAAWELRGEDERFALVALAADEDARRLVGEVKCESRG